jgi:DnaJ domain
MAYVALSIAVVLVVLLLGRAFIAANPTTLARGLQWGLGVIAILVIVLLIVTEQLGPALALIAGVLGVALRGRALWQHFGFAGGPQPGKRSEVETETLRMTLDHDTGAMDGTVLAGRFAGRRLTELGEAELVALWRECRIGDEGAAKLLETYLDRAVPNWRDGADAGTSGPRRPGRATMSREEALEILGLAAGATKEEIKAAHHRLMLKIHPDQGGSTYLAARVNEAKDLLLKRAR